jgi:cytochrome c553
MKSVRLIAAVLAALSLACAHAQEKDAKQLVTEVCSKCHGMDGNSTSPTFPKLAGQHRQYLLSQLKAFRDQSRKDPDAHTYMWEVTRQIDDKVGMNLAEYFSAQKPARGTPGDAQLAAKGKVIYEQGVETKKVPACIFCHARNGVGVAIFPRLAGQHQQYLVKQIMVFHSDDRPNNGRIMRAVAEKLSQEEAEQVAAYLQGL